MLTEVERGLNGRGGIEDLRVGDDSNEAAQDQLRETKWLSSVHQIPQPFSESVMLRSIFSMSVDENIDVGALHFSTSG